MVVAGGSGTRWRPSEAGANALAPAARATMIREERMVLMVVSGRMRVQTTHACKGMSGGGGEVARLRLRP